MNNKLPGLSLVNGVPAHAVAVTDRGLCYGDGLFETILCLDGKLVLEQQHLARLYRDAARLRIALDQIALRRELEQLCSRVVAGGKQPGVVKIIVTRQSPGRGYGFTRGNGSSRLLQYFPGISYTNANRSGVRLALSDYRLPVQPVLAGIKHLNRLEQVLAHAAIQKPFYQEALLFDMQQHLIECTASNVFLVKNGVLQTPVLDLAGVRGVMRDYILDMLAPSLKLETQVKLVMLDELLAADEVFVCNSVFGIWPVTAIHVREFPAGPVTKQLQRLADALGYPAVHA